MKRKLLLKNKIILLCLMMLLAAPLLAYADNAVSVPPEAKDVIDNAKNDYLATFHKEEEELHKLGFIKRSNDAVGAAENMENTYREAKERLSKALLTLEELQEEQKITEVELAAAQNQFDAHAAKLQNIYEQMKEIGQKSEETVKILREREIELSKIAEEAQATGKELPGKPEDYLLDWSPVKNAQNTLDYLLAEAASMRSEQQTYGNILEEKSNKAIQTETARRQAEEDLKWARLAESDATKLLASRRTARERALAEQVKFSYDLQHPPVYSGVFTGLKFYSWHGSNGNKGRQTLLPFGMWSARKNFSWSFSSSYAIGKGNNSYGSGSQHALTDVYIYLTMRQDVNSKFYLEYLFGLNIPTGRSALSAYKRNSRMPGDLVELESYGSGWQYQPGIKINWLPYKHDKWTVGTNLNFSRYYDQTSDIANDDAKPGREWSNFIRYQHAEEKWQLVVEIYNTRYKRSVFKNGSSYNNKPSWEYKLTYNRKIASDQELMLYYWPERQNKSEGGLFALSNASRIDFYGTMWRKYFKGNKDVFRVSFDVMQTNGSRFNGTREFPYPNTYTEVMGRNKYTFGLGYDHKLTSNNSLSFDLRYFWMKDGVSSIGEKKAHYKGFNIFVMFRKNF